MSAAESIDIEHRALVIDCRGPGELYLAGVTDGMEVYETSGPGSNPGRDIGLGEVRSEQPHGCGGHSKMIASDLPDLKARPPYPPHSEAILFC